MAHQVFTDGTFIWNSVNLSVHVREIHLTTRQTFTDDSNTMGNLGRKVLPVLEDYDLSVVFSQDFTSAMVDATLAVDKESNTPRAWEVRPTSAVASATNPKWTGTGYISEYEALSGNFGEVLGTRVTIVPSVAGATRAIA